VSIKKQALAPQHRPNLRLERSLNRSSVIDAATTKNTHQSPERASVRQLENSNKLPDFTSLNRSGRAEKIERELNRATVVNRDNLPIAIQRSNIGNIQLVDMQWQSTHSLEGNPVESDYAIYIPMSGRIEWQNGCYPTIHTAIAIESSRPFPGIVSTNGRVFVVGFDRESIDRALTKLIDREVKQPLVFEPTIDLANDFGASLKATIEFLGRSRAPDRNITSPMIQAELEGALLTCLLKGFRHNYADEILYCCQGAFACYVKQASTYIEAHLQDEIDLADIAAAVKISPRLLQKAFAQECECSPMRFVTRTRLERIRQQLERASSTTRIVDVMLDYGITQGGKFAKEYQQLFGEKPSDTLKRASQAAHPLWQEIDDACSERIVGGAVLSYLARNRMLPNPISPLESNLAIWGGYWRSIGIDLTTQFAVEIEHLEIN
jgi:AraC-like DNA-binding protein